MALIQIDEDEYLGADSDLRLTYESVVRRMEPGAAEILQFGAGRLAAAVRRTVDRGIDALAPGKVAERWLFAHIGDVDDALRRATVATLALVLTPNADSLPPTLLALYPSMHARLARFLTGGKAYDKGLFAGDIALCAGAFAPIGPLTIALPTPFAPKVSPARIKRAGGDGAAALGASWRKRGACLGLSMARAALGRAACGHPQPWRIQHDWIPQRLSPPGRSDGDAT